MEGLFDVIFEGRLIPGRDPALVKTALAELFKAPLDTVERLFVGGAIPIKKNIDHATAVRYISAMKEAGALARLKPVEGSVPVAAVAAPTTPAPADLTVAPVGAVLVEAKLVVERVVDTSAYSVAAVGVTLGEARNVEPVVVGDLSGYSIAAVGVTLAEAREEIPLPEPDISGLSVAAVGADLTEAKTGVPMPIADLDLSIAPAGSTLDTTEKKPPPPAPKTDHLKLS